MYYFATSLKYEVWKCKDDDDENKIQQKMILTALILQIVPVAFTSRQVYKKKFVSARSSRQVYKIKFVSGRSFGVMGKFTAIFK